jgi:hypothetical protein
MSEKILTNAFSTAISDINSAGSAVTQLLIGDKVIKEDISDQITDVDPNRAPFMRFLEKIGTKKVADNWKFQWLEEIDKSLKGTLDASNSDCDGSATGTTLAVDESNLFVARDVLMIIDTDAGTSEIVQVVSKDSATSYTISRGYSGTTALSTFSDDDEVIKIGSAFPENTGASDPDKIEPEYRYNCCQNFKESVEISGRMIAMDTRGTSDEAQKQLRSRARSLNESVEHAFLFGERHYKASSDSESTTGGLKYFIHNFWSDNEIDASSSTFNEAYLNTQSNDIFRYGSSHKIALVSGQLSSKIQSLNESYVRHNREASKLLGIQVTDYICNHGTLSFIHSRTLELSTVWQKYMFIFDSAYIKKRFMPGRDIHIRTNVQPNDLDGKKHAIEGDIGIEVRNARAHLLYTGINTTIS